MLNLPYINSTGNYQITSKKKIPQPVFLMQKYNYCFKFTVLLKVAFYAKCFLFCKLSISDPKDTKKKGHNLRFKICSTLKKFNQPQSTLNAYKSENIYSMNVNFADDIFVQKSQLMLNGIGENMFSVVVVFFSLICLILNFSLNTLHLNFFGVLCFLSLVNFPPFSRPGRTLVP